MFRRNTAVWSRVVPCGRCSEQNRTQCPCVYYVFFSTLHITGKYKGLFPREYRKFLTVRCTLTYCCECGGCLAQPAELSRARRGWGRGGRKVGTIHHCSHVCKKTFLLAARRRNTSWATCAPTVTKAAIWKKKEGKENQQMSDVLLKKKKEVKKNEEKVITRCRVMIENIYMRKSTEECGWELLTFHRSVAASAPPRGHQTAGFQ